jgi:hypothetical protein
VPPAQRAALARASEEASTSAFRTGIGIAAALVAVGGILGLIGIQDPRRTPSCRAVHAEDCSGGQLVGQPLDAAHPAAGVAAAATTTTA